MRGCRNGKSPKKRKKKTAHSGKERGTSARNGALGVVGADSEKEEVKRVREKTPITRKVGGGPRRGWMKLRATEGRRKGKEKGVLQNLNEEKKSGSTHRGDGRVHT